MPAHFAEADLDKLKEVNNRTSNGFIILLDIKDSTARKREYKNSWVLQTEILYRAFDTLCKNLAADLGYPYFVKFKGDGLMAFLQVSSSSTTRNNETVPAPAARRILARTVGFLREIEDEEISNKLCGIRLKSVICYLTDIYPLKREEGVDAPVTDDAAQKVKDALGRGIDFAHRLETYADSSHIVVNDLLLTALRNADGGSDRPVVQIDGSDLRLSGVKCSKAIKGWDGLQQFWLLTSPSMIERMITDLAPSPYDAHAKAELFRFYVSTAQREQPGALVDEGGTKPNWTMDAE